MTFLKSYHIGYMIRFEQCHIRLNGVYAYMIRFEQCHIRPITEWFIVYTYIIRFEQCHIRLNGVYTYMIRFEQCHIRLNRV